MDALCLLCLTNCYPVEAWLALLVIPLSYEWFAACGRYGRRVNRDMDVFLFLPLAFVIWLSAIVFINRVNWLDM